MAAATSFVLARQRGAKKRRDEWPPPPRRTRARPQHTPHHHHHHHQHTACACARSTRGDRLSVGWKGGMHRLPPPPPNSNAAAYARLGRSRRRRRRPNLDSRTPRRRPRAGQQQVRRSSSLFNPDSTPAFPFHCCRIQRPRTLAADQARAREHTALLSSLSSPPSCLRAFARPAALQHLERKHQANMMMQRAQRPVHGERAGGRENALQEALVAIDRACACCACSSASQRRPLIALDAHWQRLLTMPLSNLVAHAHTQTKTGGARRQAFSSSSSSSSLAPRCRRVRAAAAAVAAVAEDKWIQENVLGLAAPSGDAPSG